MHPKEESVIKCSLGGEEVFEHVGRLFSSKALSALEGYIPLYCSGGFTEVYLLKPELVEAVRRLLRGGRVPYSAGLYAGRLRAEKPRFIPSHILVEKVYRVLGTPVRAVVLAEEGLKTVLYGRDVLRASVLRCFEPVEPGEVLSVLGPDGYVYALALSRLGSCRSLEEMKPLDVVAKNVFDLGWYLRGGTKPRESKFKLA